MGFKSTLLAVIFTLLSFPHSVKAQQAASCRVLASDYARSLRAKEVFAKSIEAQKRNCESVQSARLSDVLLGRQRLDSCLREIETEKKQLDDQFESSQKKIKDKISNAPLGAPEIVDCKRALDSVNLENSPSVGPGNR